MPDELKNSNEWVNLNISDYINTQQKHIEELEYELNNRRNKFREEQLDRERHFSAEVASREKYLKDREMQLIEKQKDIELSLEQRQNELQQTYHERMLDLDNTKKQLRDEYNHREKSLSKELSEREKSLQSREHELFKKQNELELSLNKRSEELDKVWNNRLKATEAKSKILQEDLITKNIELTQAQANISIREAELQKALDQLEIEKEKYTEESRKNIESKSQSYVNDAISGLEGKETTFHNLSKYWSYAGGISIFLGICCVFISTYYGAQSIISINDFSWGYLLFITFRGLIIVALFVALARYSFIFSNSYMHESLKNSERRHAINFGKFYLEAYGSSANWEQIKEAFQHWNINNDSAFSKKQAADFDPKILENTIELTKILANSEKSKKSE